MRNNNGRKNDINIDTNDKTIDNDNDNAIGDMENDTMSDMSSYVDPDIDDYDLGDNTYGIDDDMLDRLDESLDIDINETIEEEEETQSFLNYQKRPSSTLRTVAKTCLIGAFVFFLAFNGSPTILVDKKEKVALSFADEAANNLGDVTDPMSDDDTALYWHIPKAGGTSIKKYYSCMGLVEASSGSEQRGHANDETIQVWSLGDDKFVNVDTSRQEGIVRAKNLGLAESGLADIATTMYVGAAVNMFTPEHKGRPFVLFRHPVDRAVSKFYYSQIATWEKGNGVYDPELANVDIQSYFEKQTKTKENGGYMVSMLLDKSRTEPITDEDMILAKHILREKFLVGLVTEMEESVERFDKYFGWYESEKRPTCQDLFIHKGANRNPHEEVKEGSDTWNSAVKANFFDVELYEYAVQLFEEQKNFIV